MRRVVNLGVATRVVWFAALWWMLTEGRPAYAWYGVPSVLVAAALSVGLVPPAPRRPGTLRRLRAGVALAGWYLSRVAVGGVDVAARALRRPVDIDPVDLLVDVDLPDGLARHVALGMLNLMPGSVVQEDRGTHACLHVLSSQLDTAGAWRELQRRVAAAAGIDLRDVTAR